MEFGKILGKKLEIEYKDVGSNFYTKVTLYVFAVSQGVTYSTTEVKILLSCEGVDKFPPFMLLGKKRGKRITAMVYLPWVNTDNPNNQFVPCKYRVL